MPERPTALTAAAGEHYVAFYLSAMGCLVALPRANVPGTDLLVADETGSKTLSVQVKTAHWARRGSKRNPSSSHWEWDVGRRAPTWVGDRQVYAFVDLHWGKEPIPKGLPLVPPDVFIVPSRDVANQVRPYPNAPRLRFWINESDSSKYREKWDNIAELLHE